MEGGEGCCKNVYTVVHACMYMYVHVYCIYSAHKVDVHVHVHVHVHACIYMRERNKAMQMPKHNSELYIF